MKDIVYVTPVNSIEELRQRITDAADQIRATVTSRISKTEVSEYENVFETESCTSNKTCEMCV